MKKVDEIMTILDDCIKWDGNNCIAIIRHDTDLAEECKIKAARHREQLRTAITELANAPRIAKCSQCGKDVPDIVVIGLIDLNDFQVLCKDCREEVEGCINA